MQNNSNQYGLPTQHTEHRFNQHSLRTSVRGALFIIYLLFSCTIAAQRHPEIKLLKQKSITSQGVTRGNYSGITHIAGDTFAIVTDKGKGASFRFLTIHQSPTTGKIVDVEEIPPPYPLYEDNSVRDCEDIVYLPHKRTIMVCGEADQAIVEYELNGKPTGRQVHIPTSMQKAAIQNNFGFEALAYDSTTHTIWTTTEAALKADRPKHSDIRRMRLRLQSFDSQLRPSHTYIYETEEPQHTGKYRNYTFGVPAMLSLGNAKFIVLERELSIKKAYIGSKSTIRLFLINLQSAMPVKSNITNAWNDGDITPVQKTELGTFTTRLNLTRLNLANYEGMCLGKKLTNGNQSIILINDSQNGAGNSIYRLKDYLKVVILNTK